MSNQSTGLGYQDLKLIVEARPLELSKAFRLLLLLLVGLGVIVFFQGAFFSDYETAKRSWMSLHISFHYWFFIAVAMSGFSAVFTICNAQWARSIRRLFESATPFLMVSTLGFACLYFGKAYLFEWAHHSIEGKEAWLVPEFLYVRDLVAVAVLVFIIARVNFYSISLDVCAMRAGRLPQGIDDSRWKSGRYNRYAAASPEHGMSKAIAKMGRYSPVVVIVYAVVMSLIAFDQFMSVDPHWYSTLFGALIFMSAVYGAMAWVSIGLGGLQGAHPVFQKLVSSSTRHDLGKLLFGFGIFWAYMFWSHYLPIWYGNMPEETQWVILRMREAPWHTFAWNTLGFCFIVPFLIGLNKDLKMVPLLLAATGLIVAVGLWMMLYLLFVPTLYQHNIPFGLRDLAIFGGFLGAFTLSAGAFLARVPLVPFGDLLQKR